LLRFFYIMLNQNIIYLKLTPSTMSQIQKMVTYIKIVIMTFMMIMIIKK